MSDSEPDTGATSPGTPPKKSIEITSEHRTEWKAILKHTKIHKVDQTRIAQLAFATNIKSRIQKLPRESLTTPHKRRFQVIKSEADEILSKANHLNKAFISTLLDQNSEILMNAVYLNDQERYYDALSSLEQELDNYSELLKAVEEPPLGPAPAPVDPTLINILDALQKSTQLGIDGQAAAAVTSATNQAALTTALDKLGDASSVLKPSQPHFSPQGNL